MNYPYNWHIILCKWTYQTCFSGERLKASCIYRQVYCYHTNWEWIHWSLVPPRHFYVFSRSHPFFKVNPQKTFT